MSNHTSHRYILLGRVVTMNSRFDVLTRGAVYIEGNSITAVQDAAAPPPAGFESALRLDTKGTIYPGLIELHNHLAYNALPMWQTRKETGEALTFQSREQWRGRPETRKYVNGPMSVLGKVDEKYVKAVARYTEAKCLVAGVTASQGITFASNQGIQTYYRGVVRNVEAPRDNALEAAQARAGDVETAEQFRESLRRVKGCYLLHLSEGIPDSIAREHFLRLRLPDQSWAISDALAGIHSTGLKAEDFAVLAQHGGAVVWSPLSNLLLYGQTTDIATAKTEGARLALGSDWSPSGSKNLLGELKIAKLYSEMRGGIFSDCELVEMATAGAARILRWDDSLGSIAPGLRADLLVVSGRQGDPYAKLIKTHEGDVSLVVIDGVPRYGILRLMQAFGAETERLKLRGRWRSLNLADPNATLDAQSDSLARARDDLTDGLKNLPTLAAQLTAVGAVTAAGAQGGGLTLVLDNDGMEAWQQRPLAPVTTSGALMAFFAAQKPLKDILVPMELDELTVAENPQKYFDRLRQQPNLPREIAEGLPGFYRV